MFLPAEYIREIETKTQGRFKVHQKFRALIGNSDDDRFDIKSLFRGQSPTQETRSVVLLISLETADRSIPVFETKFFEFKEVPNSIIMAGLRAQDPIQVLEGRQDPKGLPIFVFRYSRDRFFQYLKAANISEIYGLPSNYLVSLLDRLSMGMVPLPDSQSFYDWVDYLYHYARNELPEPYRIARKGAADQFVEFLGDLDSIPIDEATDQLWTSYQKTGKLSPVLEVFKDKLGRPVAVVNKRLVASRPRVYFLAEIPQGSGKIPHILTWSKYGKQDAHSKKMSRFLRLGLK